MSISDNKRVVTLASVMGLAFVGITYFGFTKNQEYEETQAKLTEISERFQDYENQEITPTKQNVDNLSAAYKEVKAVGDDMQREFGKYASFCTGQPQISAQEFQKQLLADIAAVRTMAADNKATLARPAEDLGMTTLKTATPTKDQVPFLAFQHQAVKRVVEDILSSGPASVEKVFCEELPEQASLDNKKPAEYFPLRFQVAFEAKRGTLPQVINKVMADKEFFLTITGLAVESRETPPPVSPYVAPATAVEVQGDDIAGGGNEADAPAAAPAARTIAVQLTGKDTETTRVHMTFQVLYFNNIKKK
ncbi:MAG: Amuc_1100 family pilus-like protein [Akkermansia sp.]|nr:Amuc_1100 family pilus-like protein [Akkermansia sp.]